MKIHIIIYILAFVFGLTSIVSCSENVDDVEEFQNWQAVNDDFFDNLYITAKAQSSTPGSQWKVLRNWSFAESAAKDPSDHIVVEVLKSGNGSGCPLYTDSVKVHYEGRLLPSTSYTDGYVFSKSYNGEFNPEAAVPSKFAVSGLVDGFATALQYMHIGDTWRVYVPNQLGYGEIDNGTIPAFSVLIYEITLVAYYRAGVEVPDSRAGEQAGWITE